MKLKTLLLSFILSLLVASSALAVTFTPQVTVPSPDNTGSFNNPYVFAQDDSIRPIGLLIKDIMKYLIGICGVLGTIMLMYGGFLYIISGGQGKLITDAQNHIVSAIVGIVLAATSYLILATINPDLINFKATKINQIKKEEPPTITRQNVPKCEAECGEKQYVYNPSTMTCTCQDSSTHSACKYTRNGSNKIITECQILPGPGTNQCNMKYDCDIMISCCSEKTYFSYPECHEDYSATNHTILDSWASGGCGAGSPSYNFMANAQCNSDNTCSKVTK